MQHRSYRDIILNLESRPIMPDRPPSLEPMHIGLRRILEPDLDLSELQDREIILVAGTNGKGSVCATLETLFLAAGETVGLYTSPHLEETTERFRVNGNDISQDLFCEAFEQVLKRTQGLTFTHFEMLTLMAAWILLSGKSIPAVQKAIFEVGLGGTWDATNAVPHQRCVITSLGFDHQNILGNTIEEIALNKFGIITQGATVVHSPLPSAVQGLAKEIQRKTHSRWIESFPPQWRVEQHTTGPVFIIQTPWGETPLALPGNRGIQNTATALTLFKELGFDPGPYLPYLRNVSWPGRMSSYRIERCACPIYLSGDHNADGVQSLISLLKEYPRRRLHILMGIVKDKDIREMIEPILRIPDSDLYLTEVNFRKRSLEEYQPWLSQAAGAWRNPEDAFENVISRAAPEDLVLVTGSLYLVGQIKKLLH